MPVQPFRGSDWPTLGVELEMQIIDRETKDLSPVGDDILGTIPEEFAKSVKPELYQCCVEVNTGICRDVDEVGRDLAAKLAMVSEHAVGFGAEVAWGGAHPFSYWLDQDISVSDRYAQLIEDNQDTIRRQLTFGLHVHVGVADGDTAARACTRVSHYLPTLLALSANSPFWCGRDTGLSSYRLDVMGVAPTGGQPPFLRDWESFVRLAEHLASVGSIKTTKELWWDVRPSDRFGTVEVRICDMPTDLASVQGLTALIQCLIHHMASDKGFKLAELNEFGRLMIRQNRWRAARHGLDAVLVDPETGGNEVARDAVRRMTETLAPTAEHLGCSHWLEHARAMAERPDGATRQREVFAKTGRLTDVVRFLAGEDVLAEEGVDVEVKA
ncbi:YbdK family carboxylate-amine ligase [Planctomyces sp. SH-PL62]|uniref:carboxylate-amine ligase n=1 Tax=Planctomyces sp. SH-PL62 TaxID=1636152 RepID=UPI00078C03DE|nr:YbdK family carboxylate-amine ligase [Planctomyces sp. SH-PL62]AMV36590.1 Carboxylate-amine ligase YbdK [Planctomyces sp. SH-PL62]